MGYYTNYKLSYSLPEQQANPEIMEFIKLCSEKGIKIPTEVQSKIDSSVELRLKAEAIFNGSSGESSGYLLKDFLTGDASDCKWYDHEDDLKRISLQLPDVLIVLEGNGEDREDQWIKYFKNGKIQTCKAKITFEPYDESKLR